MADPTFQIVDHSNTVLFDLNDPTGATNRRSLKTWLGGDANFGEIAPELSIEPRKGRESGSMLLTRRNPHTTGQWNQRVQAASYDDLVTGVGEMLRLLAEPPQGARLLWKPAGAVENRYLDYLTAAPIPSLLRGQDFALGQVMSLLADEPGLPISVLLQPYSYGDRLDPAVNVLTNSTLLATTGTRPDGWAWNTTTSITAESVVAADEAFRFTIATNTTRGLRQEAALASAAPGQIWSGSFYARLAPTSANASARMRVALDYMDSGSAVLSGENGSTIALTTRWQRFTFTGTATPASTDHVRLTMQLLNSDSNANDVELRYAQLEKASVSSRYRTSVATVSNDPAGLFGKVIPVFCEGDLGTPARLDYKAGPSAATMQIVLAKVGNDGEVGGRSLVDYLNASKFLQCETGTAGTDTATGTSVAASPQTGNTHMVTTFNTVESMAKRVRMQKTTQLDSLRGTFDVYCRFKVELNAKVRLQLRWGPSLASPVANSEDPITVDTTAASVAGYISRKLGRVTMPSDPDDALAGMTFELWASRLAGAGSLRMDYISFIPVDDSQIGRISTAGYQENWKGNELITPTSPGASTGGTVSGANLKLDTTNETGGTPPNAGLPLDVGHHRVTFKYKTQGNPAYIERIRDITANSSPFDIESQWLGNKTIEETIEFDSVAGHSYQFQIVFTGDNGDPDSLITVLSIVHEFVPYLTSGQHAVSDAEQGTVQLFDSSGFLVQDLDVQDTVPLWLTPGLNVIYVDVIDIPFDAAMNDGASVITRTPDVKVLHTPRWITRL